MSNFFMNLVKSVADWKTTVPAALLGGAVVVANKLGWFGLGASLPDLMTGVGFIVTGVLAGINTKKSL